MNGYFINFLVYTLAMVGIMLLSIIVYKKTALSKNFGGNKNSMKIEESLNLSPKKTLYVINVRGERFLIASDMERTSFLAKLDNNSPLSVEKISEISSAQKNIASSEGLKHIIPGIDPQEIRKAAAQKRKLTQTNMKSFSQIFDEEFSTTSPVMKNLAGKMRIKRG